MDQEVIQIRIKEPEDDNFIFATWHRGLLYGNSILKFLNKDYCISEFKALTNKVMKDPKTIVRIACLSEDPSVIVGYSVSNMKTLHFIYVKEAWRRMGLAKKLMPEQIEAVTTTTEFGKYLLKKKLKHIRISEELIGDLNG